MALCKTSATYWEGDAKAETLSRIYGISFPDTKQLKEWQIIQVRQRSIHVPILQSRKHSVVLG